MSWGTRCSVPYCNGRGGHRFPKNAEIKELWIRAVKRANWRPTSGSLICKKHFEPTDYVTESFYHGNAPAHGTLKKGTVPTLFMPTNTVVMTEKRQPVKKIIKPSEDKIMHVKGFDAEGNPLPCFDSLRDKLGIGKDQPVSAASNPNLLNSGPFENDVTIVSQTPDEDFSFLNNHDPTMAAVRQIKEEIMCELDQDVDEDSGEIFEILQENNRAIPQTQYRNIDQNGSNPVQYDGNIDQNGSNPVQYDGNIDQNRSNPVPFDRNVDDDQNPVQYHRTLNADVGHFHQINQNSEEYGQNIASRRENVDENRDDNDEENRDTNEGERLSGESSEEENNTDETVGKSPNLGIDKFVRDNQAVSYYTGLDTYHRFCYALRTLGNDAYQLNFLGSDNEISVKNQFFLTLMKLKQNKDKFELSRFFQISEDCVSDIITTWINFVAKKWKEFNKFPSKEITNYFRGISGFKETFANVRSRGGSKPKKIKNSEKMKFNPGVKLLTPDSLLSFVSEAYGVKINEPTNSTILASESSPSTDRVISNQNENIAKTTLERVKPTKATEQREKAIVLEKTFKILADSTLTDAKLKDDVVFICFTLMNIRNGRI